LNNSLHKLKKVKSILAVFFGVKMSAIIEMGGKKKHIGKFIL